MHLIVPFAAPPSDAGRAAARTLALPNLARLLGLLDAQHSESAGRADEWSLSPPHERALALALGLSGADGAIPWAARNARADGVDAGTLAWGQVTPAHWHLGTEQVSLVDPATLMLDAAGSRDLLNAVADLFTGDGFVLAYGAPLRWYAAHESLAGLPTASLDRVVGRNVDRWLGSDPAARRLRRLQAEVQMRLHAHPLNAQREARGLLPVNSFWISGCGAAQPEHSTAGLVVDDRLRAPALAEDAAAWVKAWDSLDASAIAACAAALDQGQPVQLTLCGERASATFAAVHTSPWRRLRSRWQRPAWPALFERL
jgi:hypothetical protein